METKFERGRITISPISFDSVEPDTNQSLRAIIKNQQALLSNTAELLTMFKSVSQSLALLNAFIESALSKLEKTSGCGGCSGSDCECLKPDPGNFKGEFK